ncbi:MAG: SDR family oxidoreductase [Clostridia bacterium]|nr:SDR family oxidoreductase [Clostridia bacterium]
MFDLKGKVALLTGAKTGLGRDMAEVFAENGCDIIITSRTQEKAQEAADEIAAKYGVEAIGLALEVNSVESVEALAEAAFGWKGHIDILVNNSGGGSGASEGHLFDRSYEAIENMIKTNLTGTIFVCKAVGRYMKEQKSGKIINIGSIAGVVGRDRRMYYEANKMEQPVDYAAAKGGVIALTRDLAAVLAPYNVNVNCISPGGFDKGELPEDFVRLYSNRTPLGYMGRIKKDIKGAALFLATAASDYVTGINLLVDGGFSSWQ